MRDNIDQKYFKKRLADRLAEIIAGQTGRKGDNPLELDQTKVGRLSRMDAVQQQAMAKAAARLTVLERQRIEAALKRIHSGEYGYCVLSGEEVAEGRLCFDPSVATCISCAKKTESR
jgi:DnaK suppressor protein